MKGSDRAKIVLGTRGSHLAVQQAKILSTYLELSGYKVEWKYITTSGDRWLSGSLCKTYGNGFFTRELEVALLAREVDVIVHSFKDIPLERPDGIVTACVPQRGDSTDLLLMRLDAPDYPTIGTSSERRLRFVSKIMPHANFTWIRGSVPTRIQQVRNGTLRGIPLHGTILASAGIKRLGIDISDMNVRAFDLTELLPAPAQGAILVETHRENTDILNVLANLHHSLTYRLVMLERAVLAGIGGGCQQPFGALAVYEPDGKVYLRAAYVMGDRHIWAEGRDSDDKSLVATILKKLIL